MPRGKKEAPAGNEGRIHKLNSQLKDAADRAQRQDPIESSVAFLLAFQSLDELWAMEILPDEAAILERIRRHTDTYRLLVQTVRAYLREVEE